MQIYGVWQLRCRGVGKRGIKPWVNNRLIWIIALDMQGYLNVVYLCDVIVPLDIGVFEMFRKETEV
jgi:hypothetical protein